MAYLIYKIKSLIRIIRNLKKRYGKTPAYIIFTLEGEYLDLPPKKGGFFQNLLTKKTQNLKDLTHELEQVKEDPRVKGVILKMYRPDFSQAGLQTLRSLLLKLKEKEKEIITWAPSYNRSTYYLASLAHQILLQEGGEIGVLGLKKRFLFLRDGLKQWGITFQLIPITPYKSAGDTLTRNKMSKEARDMEEWVLEDIYQEYLERLSEGRQITKEKAIEIIDNSPYSDLEGKDLGLVDEIISQEEIPAYLKNHRISTWKKASSKLYQRPLPHPKKGIALIRVQGIIVDGESKRPPVKLPIPLLMEPRVGDLTLVQEIREVLKNKRYQAVVLYIDSGGGSATASEAIAAALRKLVEKKPLVVAMGSVAASGGYYIGTPASYIMAHPMSITGSIGVLGGKLIDEGLFQKLLVNREIMTKGKSSLMNDSSQPYTKEELEKIKEKIQRTYQIFLERVAWGRNLTIKEVDEIGGGRVWTGRQALKRGLIDGLGGLPEAIEKAKELAHLPPEAQVFEIKAPKEEIPPVGETNALFTYLWEGVKIYREGSIRYQIPYTMDFS